MYYIWFNITNSTSIFDRKERTLSEGSDGGKNNLGISTTISLPLSGKQEKIVSIISALRDRRNDSSNVLQVRDNITSDLGILYCWNLKPKRTGRKNNHISVGQENQLEDTLTKLSTLDKEFSSLLRLSNENIVNYVSMKFTKQNDTISVFLLQEYVQGISLSYYLDHKIPLSYPFLKHVNEGTLKALHFLHQNNVVHRDLRDSSIYIDKKAGVIRVADYSIERRLIDCAQEFYSIKPQYVYPQSPGRGGKKGDIYRLGLVMLSLYAGERVTQVCNQLLFMFVE